MQKNENGNSVRPATAQLGLGKAKTTKDRFLSAKIVAKPLIGQKQKVQEEKVLIMMGLQRGLPRRQKTDLKRQFSSSRERHLIKTCSQPILPGCSDDDDCLNSS